jgi:hypothetical protein
MTCKSSSFSALKHLPFIRNLCAERRQEYTVYLTPNKRWKRASPISIENNAPKTEIPRVSLSRLADDDGFEVIIYLRILQQRANLLERVWDIWIDEFFLPRITKHIPPNDSQGYSASATEAKTLSTKRYTKDMRCGKERQHSWCANLGLPPSLLSARNILQSNPRKNFPRHHMLKNIHFVKARPQGPIHMPCLTTLYDTPFLHFSLEQLRSEKLA